MNRFSVTLFIFILTALLCKTSRAQSVQEQLRTAFRAFEQDPQMRNGIASLYVVEAKTGRVVYEKNGSLGLVPASTQKVITSVSAYEMLGEGFRFETKFAYQKSPEHPSLLIIPGGDPTLGSWRWPFTKESVVLGELTQAVKKTGIRSFGDVVIANNGWNEETIPDGWMWQDIANYYGAGTAKLNWRENQYDVILRSGKRIGDPVTVVKTVPYLYNFGLRSELTSAAAGTGDNAYIYFPLNGSAATIRGTIPVNQNSFKISGAMPSAADQFVHTLADTLKALGISAPAKPVYLNNTSWAGANYTVFHTVKSPPLDSVIYWFNQKSVNLYGEALVKAIAVIGSESSSTEKGLKLIRDFWKKRGIPETELSMVDGSGLSPLNHVTTHAQVEVLQYARKQGWYDGFYASLPMYNGMKMKSGTLSGVKGYTGYHISKDGEEYVFSFLVNNYNGSAGAVVQKMYKVLDVLK